MSLEHLVGLRDVDAGTLEQLLEDATEWRTRLQNQEAIDLLRGRCVGLIFLEPSTRTRFSFERAARNLGADVMAMSAEGSSTSKGETLWDTAKTLQALGAHALVLRHRYVGAPHQLAQRVDVPVINAGDGINEHPTQALLDALTLQDQWGSLAGRTVLIVGDIRHSRVARSNCFALPRLGARVLLYGPGSLCPNEMSSVGVEIVDDFDAALAQTDAVMMLRIQRERMGQGMLPSDEEYSRFYGLNSQRLDRARPGVLVLHPGPMNRGLEISSSMADGPASLIFQQKANGVAVRMAVLARLLASGARS